MELQGQQCRARPTPIRCDRYYLLALHRIARARVCVPVTCHLSPPDRLRPPAILMKVEQACTLILPMSSAACKPGTVVAATTDLGHCSPTYLYLLLAVKRSLYLTYKDLSCPYMRHHSTVPTYVLHGAPDPLHTTQVAVG